MEMEIWVVISIAVASLPLAFISGVAWEYVHYSKKWDKKLKALQKEGVLREQELDKTLLALKSLES